ncbi:MAG: helix-turn-helix domain-containing protein [Propionibacteriaceae bacterium]|nr:helix-turn-helix domain-containing protein [Propionibacteriaceae bacterium]
MSRAARMYYVEGASQRAIAQALKVSVPTVSRLVQRAKDEGVIQFSIREPYASCQALERDLLRAYGLSDALVTPTGGVLDGDLVKRGVALEGAKLVQRVATPKDTLGVAWGGTMCYLIQYLNPCRRVPARFVTLHGSISCCGRELDVRTLVGRMSKAFGGSRHVIESDGLPRSPAAGEAPAADGVAAVCALFEKITISVSGVGSLHPGLDSPLVRSNYLRPAEVDEVVAAGAYGDIVLRFFDADGAECDTSLRDRTLAIALEQYRKIPLKVVAASGAHKARTVAAALRGGLADVLVLDEGLARAVLEQC